MRDRWALRTALAGAITLCVASSTWAAPATYRVPGGQSYTCTNRGPYDEYIRRLQARRNALRQEIENLNARLIVVIRQGREAMEAYNAAVAAGNGPAQNATQTLYGYAVIERRMIEAAIEEKNSELRAVQKQIEEAIQDMRRSCGGCPPGSVRPGGVGYCRE